MKCIVVYHSITGNTEKVAKAIQAGVSQAVGHCDIVKMKEANPRRLYEYDLIGIGSPVYGAVPPNVVIFVNNMRFVGGKHIFAFTTHGTLEQFFFPTIVPKLKKQGLIVIGTGDWFGDCYLGHMPRPYPTGGHPDEIDLKEAEDFGREMVMRSWRISAGEIDLIPPVPEAPPPLVIPESELPSRSKMKFYKEKCLYPKCRLCMDNCPLDGIDLSVEPPVIAEPCQHCEFCARICPTGALDIDASGEITTSFALKHMQQFFLPNLAQAEAEGHFRRLVPLEEIGYSTPVYKIVRNKHPQWIIGKGLQ